MSVLMPLWSLLRWLCCPLRFIINRTTPTSSPYFFADISAQAAVMLGCVHRLGVVRSAPPRVTHGVPANAHVTRMLA